MNLRDLREIFLSLLFCFSLCPLEGEEQQVPGLELFNLVSLFLRVKPVFLSCSDNLDSCSVGLELYDLVLAVFGAIMRLYSAYNVGYILAP